MRKRCVRCAVGARYRARASSPAAVEHSNDGPMRAIEGAMRRACGDSARHEREHVRDSSCREHDHAHFDGSSSMPHLPVSVSDHDASFSAQEPSCGSWMTQG